VSKSEWRRALPALGIAVAREDADTLFDELDKDGSGEISYEELNKQLRAGVGVELDASLVDGAAGIKKGKNPPPMSAAVPADVTTVAQPPRAEAFGPALQAQVAGWITPVPGGVGPMTVAMLMANTLLAAELRLGKR
jgi:hypothetical protein